MSEVLEPTAGYKRRLKSGIEKSESKKKRSDEAAPLREVDDDVLRETMLRILEKRKQGATCCPSEIPRSLPLADWRAWMEPTRRVAQRLAREGLIDILQVRASTRAVVRTKRVEGSG
jgi:hypothetical protein